MRIFSFEQELTFFKGEMYRWSSCSGCSAVVLTHSDWTNIMLNQCNWTSRIGPKEPDKQNSTSTTRQSAITSVPPDSPDQDLVVPVLSCQSGCTGFVALVWLHWSGCTNWCGCAGSVALTWFHWCGFTSPVTLNWSRWSECGSV